MATRIVSLLLMAALLVSSCLAQDRQSEVLTLERAIQLALQDNRQIKNAEIEVFKFEDRLAAARTQRLPEFKITALGSQLLSSIDFKFERGVFGNYPGLGPIPSTDTTISTPRRPTFLFAGQINQPLSQLYRIGLNLKQIGAGREIAEQQARRSGNPSSTTSNGLITRSCNPSALRASEEAVRLFRELDRVTGDYVVQQVALKSEGLEVKTRLAKSEYEATTLRDQLASQKSSSINYSDATFTQSSASARRRR